MKLLFYLKQVINIIFLMNFERLNPHGKMH